MNSEKGPRALGAALKQRDEMRIMPVLVGRETFRPA